MFWRFLLKRLGQMFIVLFFVVVIAFLLVRITPGSPARQLLGMMATEEDIAAKEIELGLDKPIYVQFWIYLRGILSGDLGDSIQYHQPVSKVFFNRLPNTLILGGVALIVGLVIAIPVGIIAGSHQGIRWN